MRSLHFTFLVICVAFVSGCFWFGVSERRIVGDYRLEQWEDGTTYYLIKAGAPDSGVGVIEGTVIEIGWNDRYILVNRHASWGGEPNGWMILDSQSGTLTGPTLNSDLRTRPEVRGIKVYSAKDAWSKLWF